MLKKIYLNLLSLVFAVTLLTCNIQASSNIGKNFLTKNKEVYGFIQTENMTNINETIRTNKFDLQKGVVMLNSGYEMPILGIGTYLLSNTQAENSVYNALKDGYRLIDTARIYGNEEGVGRGIKRAIEENIVKREEIL